MTRDASSHPIDTLWQAPAIVWSILAGECLALVLALSPGVEANRLVLFGLASFLIQWVILLTLGSLYGLRKWIRRLRPLHVAYLGLLGLLIWTWIAVGSVRMLLGPSVLGTSDASWPWPVLRITGIVVAVGVLGLAALHNHWQAQRSAVRAKHAELEALQARTHPHFLFNSLNTAIALVHQRPAEAEQVLLDLSDLFRAALAGPRHIRLEEEVGLVRRYLEIEQLRLAERLTVRWELPPSLPEVEVPALAIQPLAENAVRHGIERRVEGGRIDILVTVDDMWINVTVRNDLPDRTDVTAPTPGHGVGLPSVASRIEAMTDGRGALSTGAADGRYVATIRLPAAPAAT
ncbi:sensor histidine kinase [Luteimonas terricola]|uniref:Alginate biosynthesis protein AlgZ/FimS n=1 Tax=Luteimonas terricola TaxID=645597 RepID=A0ABQ2EGT9_9GAMM|nr:histidine kinase [Luteimonas terricola]GGK11016.1 alginate biosynthesis protein AlgZ/FimS [Luteimonas terricola]